MTSEQVFAASIFVLLVFIVALYASKPQPEETPQPAGEVGQWIGDFFFYGFLISYGLWCLQNAKVIP